MFFARKLLLNNLGFLVAGSLAFYIVFLLIEFFI